MGTALATDTVAQLRETVTGTVHLRGEEGLAAEVECFNPTILHDPDLVVAARSEGDIAAAVRFARENDLRVRVHATGHGAAGIAVTDGVLISTRALDSVTVDPEARLAIIGAGARWAPVIAATAEHGLAAVTGSSISVGAVGYTLGGGLGPLARSHGFTADWVRGFRVVTADGEVVTADATTNDDLFWALRGGKGGFGVVTEMTIELIPLATLYAGSLFFEGDAVETAFHSWADWAAQLPEQATTSAVFLQIPDVDGPPPPLRGRSLLSVRFAFPGDATEGARLLAPLREAAPVYLDFVAEIPTTAVGTIHNDPEVGGPDWVRGLMLDSFDRDAAAAFLALVGPGTDSPFVAAEIRQLGGVTSRDTADGTAVGGRDGAFTVSLISGDPAVFDELAPVREAAIREAFADRLAEITNVNWSAGLVDRAAFEKTWPPAILDRLAVIRAERDPEGVFAFGPQS
ncbi:FAD-binding oxidoreductase [Leifsonia poae]|uniref:FAD-binding oxidoreductase n=1 Tax=Leifsonia poae TaxID=110933 RepID=UPI001CBCB489|nr:FAD-binding oxidoreductase [Leifsonia poae]